MELVNRLAGWSLARKLATVAALIVIVDAVSVGAPGLALLALPFVVAAVRFRGRRIVSRVLLVAYCALYLAIAINYAVANGVDAPAGDLLFAYVGGLVVLALAIVVVRPAPAGAPVLDAPGRPQFG